jgi:hypothetical protein
LLIGSLSFSSTGLELAYTSWLQQNHLHDNNLGQSLLFTQNHQDNMKKESLTQT